MLPSLEKTIIPFLRVHILSVKIYTIFMLCITKQYRWPNITFLITFSSTKRCTKSVTHLVEIVTVFAQRSGVKILDCVKLNVQYVWFWGVLMFRDESKWKNVACHDGWIIGSIENAEISVFWRMKRCSKRCISVANIVLKYIP